MLIRSLRIGALVATVVAATTALGSLAVASTQAAGGRLLQAGAVDLAAVLHVLWL